MINSKAQNYYRNNLTKRDQEMLYVSLIAYDHDLQRLACQSIVQNVFDNLVETLMILYRMNIDISSKEGFYLGELISFWSTFSKEEIGEIIAKDIGYFYSPIMLSHNLKQEEAIRLIDESLANINTSKKSFILGIISILKQNEKKYDKSCVLTKTTK